MKDRKQQKKIFFGLAMMLAMTVLLGAGALAANITKEHTIEVNSGEWGSEQIGSEEETALFYFTVPSDGMAKIYYQTFLGVSTLCYLRDGDLAKTYYDRQVYSNSAVSPQTIDESFSLSAGTYCAMVKAYKGGQRFDDTDGGTVRVKVEFTPYYNTEKEPNNIFEQAAPLPEGVSLRGALTEDDKTDFYKFVLSSADKVTFSANATEISNIRFDLYDGDYIRQASETIQSYRGSWTKEMDLKAGTYYITINDLYNLNSYQLKWEGATKAPVLVTDISLNKEKATLNIGKKVSLTASVKPSDAENKTIKWSSSNKKVATVSQSGKVTAKKAGMAVITAASADGSGVYAECVVVVKPKKAKIASLSNGSAAGAKKRYVKIKLSKISGADGYQIAVSKYKNRGYKSCLVTTKTSVKVKAARKTKFYYKVRAYVLDESGKKVYGAYSAPKSIKVKK